MPESRLYLVTGGLTGFQLREYFSRVALRVCLAEANVVPAGIMVREQNFFPKALCKLSHRRICRTTDYFSCLISLYMTLGSNGG